jgi:parallel beta-helix repeat protein
MKLRTPATLLALILATLALSALPASAGPTTIDVFPGESIQEAVNGASPGDTIVVHEGVYEGSVAIRQNGITLVGETGTVLMPGGTGRACNRGIYGICVGSRTGDIVADVTISGFRVQDFPVFGIVGFGTRNLTIASNTLVDDGEYGVAAFGSVGTKIVENVATGNFIGAYIGDSPRARATVANNTLTDNGMGLFIRAASLGTVRDNVISQNCVGIFVLHDGSITPERWLITSNTINRNNLVCEGREPLAGTGILLLGADDNEIVSNTIVGNRARGGLASGGVALLSAGRRATPDGNRIIQNDLVRNRPNILTDGTGRRNVIRNNNCTGPC